MDAGLGRKARWGIVWPADDNEIDPERKTDLNSDGSKERDGNVLLCSKRVV